MPLPVRPLPTTTVDVDGTSVEVRSLSRAEALKLNGFVGREDEAEVFILMAGTGCTEDEARAWREAVDVHTAGLLIDAVIEVSGLVGKDGKDPKSDTNGTS